LQMVRKLTGEQLEGWLDKVAASHLQAFQPFVTGVQTDKDAVLAGLTLPWSNGPVEGQVNRLKLIKRESGMVEQSSIFSGFECFTKIRRVWRERTRGRKKRNREITRRHREAEKRTSTLSRLQE